MTHCKVFLTAVLLCAAPFAHAGKGGGGKGGGPDPDPAISYRLDLKQGGFALMVINDDGSNATELLAASSLGRASWSPDGTQLAFQGNAGGAGIHVVNADGTGLHQVFTRSESGFLAGVAWSPVPAADGRHKLAFGYAPDGGRTDLFVMDLDGTGLQNLTATPGQDEDGPTWSPDATRIAVSRHASGQPDDVLVFALGLSGGTLAVTGSTAVAFPLDALDWARTGDRLAGMASGDLWILDLADPWNPVNVTNSGEEERHPAWSPDDARLVFWRRNHRGKGGLFTMASDGSGAPVSLDPKGFLPAWRRNP